MNILKQSIFTLAALSLALSACSGQQNAYNAQRGGVSNGAGLTKSDVGTGLGAVAGGVAGAQFGKGNGRLVATALGALVGASVGNSIGASLDRADMTYYNQAQQKALETAQPGQSLPWNNPQNGHSGSFIPAAPYQNDAGQYCREYNEKVNIGGEIQSAYGRACRQPDGSWQIVSQ